MMMDKDHDLGLSLGLSSSDAQCSLQLNLKPSSSPPLMMFQSKLDWTADFRSQSERRTVLASRGIDVNYAPVTEIEIDEDAGACSPNSTVSTGSGGVKRRYEAVNGVAGVNEEIDTDLACLRGASDEEDGEGSRKKLRLSKGQAAILEDSFKENNTLNPKQKLALANKLHLRPRQVEVWFQNRRARTKLKQTEVDCEYLKLCCENLREENRRLQKEVQDLRALKLSSQFYMRMTPPMTLTMCPSCERIAPSSASAPPPPQPATSHPAEIHQLFPPQTRPPASPPPSWAPIVLRPSYLDAIAPPQRS